MKRLGMAVMCIVSCNLLGSASEGNAQDSPVTHYYSLSHDWPPLPENFLGLPEVDLGNGMVGLKDEDVDYDLIAEIYSLSQALSGGGIYSLDSEPPAPPGSGGTNIGGSGAWTAYSYSSNEVYLEIVAVTNNIAWLVIHPPWNGIKGVYDLQYCTNLAPPISWQRLLRTEPGQTELTVANATDAHGFYRLSPPDDLAANSSVGTNFWIAFMEFYSESPRELSLYISSPVGATGAVTLPGLGITNAFSVAAGGVTNVAIDYGITIVSYDVVGTNGVHVASSHPVSVFVSDYEPANTATFTAYPTPLLGTNYYVMSYAYWYSEFAIVATSDGTTTVRITPSPTANLVGHPGTNAYDVTLQRGQTYQNTGADFSDEVTGTRIASDKPIAVFAGTQNVGVPFGFAAGNPLVQQQLPVNMWGTQALALSFAGRMKGDSYRVLAANDNTVVFTNSVVAGTNQAGQFLELIIDGPVEFQGSQPIQVAHFANGYSYDDSPYGDPCEILLPSMGHYLTTNTVFSLPNDGITGDFVDHYLNIIVIPSAIPYTRVDGFLVASTNFVAIGTSGYSGARLSVTNGVHTVTSSQPVGVEVYGFGEYDAYGYFGGTVK